VERNDYSAVAKSLHWLIALLVFVLFPLAWFMDDFSGIAKFKAYNLHKSLGITVLALMFLRLLWRLARPTPTLPATMPRIERIAAHLGHFALYIVLFLMPVTGWAMISSSDKPSVLFQYTAFPMIPWLSQLPADDKKVYAEFFHSAHGVISYVLLTLIAIHIAAALRHAIILRDGILSRMLPRFGQSPAPLRITALAIVAGALSLGGGKASASEWSVNPKKSEIGFEANGSGYNTKGTFGKYQAEIEFDPDLPEQAAIRVRLDMNSAATGTSDVDSTLQSADYFNPAKYPAAEFVARGAKANGNGQYVLNGRLTLKGVTKPVSLPFSIAIKDGTATVKAETKINRLEFGVGPETVAGLPIDKDVKLTINLTALKLDN
jgi:cytochrome b561/polyisoprenoid-binding protein YceI